MKLSIVSWNSIFFLRFSIRDLHAEIQFRTPCFSLSWQFSNSRLKLLILSYYLSRYTWSVSASWPRLIYFSSYFFSLLHFNSVYVALSIGTISRWAFYLSRSSFSSVLIMCCLFSSQASRASIFCSLSVNSACFAWNESYHYRVAISTWSCETTLRNFPVAKCYYWGCWTSVMHMKLEGCGLITWLVLSAERVLERFRLSPDEILLIWLPERLFDAAAHWSTKLGSWPSWELRCINNQII